MATYTTILRETERVEVVDAFDHHATVTASGVYIEHLSVTKRYAPVLKEVVYRLDDGRTVVRQHKAFFETEDRRSRFFLV